MRSCTFVEREVFELVWPFSYQQRNPSRTLAPPLPREHLAQKFGSFVALSQQLILPQPSCFSIEPLPETPFGSAPYGQRSHARGCLTTGLASLIRGHIGQCG